MRPKYSSTISLLVLRQLADAALKVITAKQYYRRVVMCNFNRLNSKLRQR